MIALNLDNNYNSQATGKFHNWFLLIYFMAIVMVIIGGVTRLTGSGLSIVDWKPLMGILPPITTEDWRELFAQYRQTPQFQQVNFMIDLVGFKKIFWLEYIHRFVGRSIGIVLLIPTLYLFTNSQYRRYSKGIMALWMLGLAQALVGWFMVKSGLKNDPNVSPYFLVAHLTMAMVIIYVCLQQYCASKNNLFQFHHKKLRIQLLIALKLVTLTIIMGGFVAGNKAGLIYNTFPLMNGAVLPDNMWELQPLWRNIFENHGCIQFIHRYLAILAVLYIWYVFIRNYFKIANPGIQRLLLLIAVIASLQVALGIITLLSFVHMHVAVTHQAFAFLLYSVLCFSVIRMKNH